MRKGGGRAKGAGFERTVAKMIFEAFKPLGFKKEDCWRTPQSGGHWAASHQAASDLQFSPELSALIPLAIECKSYHKLNWNELIERKSKTQFAKWWKQASKAAAVVNKAPMLVVHQNNGGVWAVLAADTFEEYIAGDEENLSEIVSVFVYSTIGAEKVVMIPFDYVLRRLVG